MSAEFLDFILEVVISYLVPILELIGVFIVAYGTIVSDEYDYVHDLQGTSN
jgi:hypothetical protein